MAKRGASAVAPTEGKRKRGGCLKPLMLGLGGLLLVGGIGAALGGGENDDTSPTSATTSTVATSDATQSEETETSEAVVDEAPEEDATDEEAPEPAEEEAPEDDMTASQRNAVRSAENYLSFSGFSRQGLIDQLSSEYGDQFSVEDATFAVDHLEAEIDWNEQAAKSAENYLSVTPFSRQGLIDQLSSEYGDKYTVEEATAGVDAIESDVDWNEQAAKAAQNYLEISGFSRQGLIDQLSSEYGDKYTVEQATYGVDQAGL